MSEAIDLDLLRGQTARVVKTSNKCPNCGGAGHWRLALDPPERRCEPCDLNWVPGRTVLLIIDPGPPRDVEPPEP